VFSPAMYSPSAIKSPGVTSCFLSKSIGIFYT
jgi:hypothetical protein